VQDHAADALLLLGRVRVVNDLSVELAILEGAETGALVSMTTWALIPSVPSLSLLRCPPQKATCTKVNVLRLCCIGGFTFIHHVLFFVLLDQERIALLSSPGWGCPTLCPP
jgi:hypothetical protein